METPVRRPSDIPIESGFLLTGQGPEYKRMHSEGSVKMSENSFSVGLRRMNHCLFSCRRTLTTQGGGEEWFLISIIMMMKKVIRTRWMAYSTRGKLQSKTNPSPSRISARAQSGPSAISSGPNILPPLSLSSPIP